MLLRCCLGICPEGLHVLLGPALAGGAADVVADGRELRHSGGNRQVHQRMPHPPDAPQLRVRETLAMIEIVRRHEGHDVVAVVSHCGPWKDMHENALRQDIMEF